jgi:cation transport ATPase
VETVQAQSTTTRRIEIDVRGLGYGPAVQRIEQELSMVPGVSRAYVNPASSRAQVSCAATTHQAELLAALGRLGFRAELVGSN